jgi:hypothetical protein
MDTNPAKLPTWHEGEIALQEKVGVVEHMAVVDRDDRRQVDVSHRGGNAGFVRIGNDGVLTIPDFDGNLFFSTLGNIFVNGKAGLLFVDFATGDICGS